MNDIFAEMTDKNIICTSEYHLYSCIDLLFLYNSYMEPYLNEFKNIIDKEEAIMCQFYMMLEDNHVEGIEPIFTILDSLPIPSDINSWFKHSFMHTANKIINDMVLSLKGKIVAEFFIERSFTVKALIVTYKYTGVNDGPTNNAST